MSARRGPRSHVPAAPSYEDLVGDLAHTGFYDEAGPIGLQDQLRMELLVAESAGVDPGSTVLEVGCGNGAAACRLARQTGARMRGVTASGAQLESARAAAESQGVGGRVRFDLGEPDALPYPDASFDAVLFFESPSRCADRERMLAEAWRVLRPGGRLAGEDWLASEGAPEPLRQLWCDRIALAWGIPPLSTLGTYARALARAGFALELARDLRDEMPLLRGFLADPVAREVLRAELAQGGDPFHRLRLEGMLTLGEAAENGAFTVGRFVARKRVEE